MAWTAPMTFVANTTLTSAQLNTYLRDNLNETAPAKATTPSSYFVSNGPNSIVERQLAVSTVSTSQSTTSTSYTDLATVGPSVTVTTGAYALVMWSVLGSNTNADTSSNVSFAVSGASSVSADDAYRIYIDGLAAGNSLMSCMVFMMSSTNGLVAGSNTFTLKYKAGNFTSTFSNRRIQVLPF